MLQIAAGRSLRIRGDENRVGPHVRDRAGLVQLLGSGHGVRHRRLQPGRGRLLEHRRGERRLRLLTHTRTVDVGKREDAGGQTLHVGFHVAALVVTEHGAVAIDQLRDNRISLAGDRKMHIHAIERPGGEDADTFVPVHKDLEGGRLDTAGRQPRHQALTEQRRQLIADDAIQETPRHLGTHERLVDRAGLLERGKHRRSRNLREGDPPKPRRVAAQDVRQVPGNGLALAVEVGGQIDGAGTAGRLKLTNNVFLAGNDLPRRPPAVGDIEAHAGAGRGAGTGRRRPRCRLALPACSLGRKVSDMSERSPYGIGVTQDLVDLAGLAGTLYDDKRALRHGLNGCNGQTAVNRSAGRPKNSRRKGIYD